jgi:hypothetical protein
MQLVRTQRSTFVTVIAWIFLVASAWIAYVVLAGPWTHPAGDCCGILRETTTPEDQRMTAWLNFLTQHRISIFIGYTAILLSTFIASLGLLRRVNWARLLFMGIMGIAVLAIAGLIVLMNILQTLTPILLVIRLGVAAVFGWIAWKLRSPPIVEEFHSA